MARMHHEACSTSDTTSIGSLLVLDQRKTFKLLPVVDGINIKPVGHIEVHLRARVQVQCSGNTLFSGPENNMKVKEYPNDFGHLNRGDPIEQCQVDFSANRESKS